MTSYSSQDLIDECPGLTYRKLDYWCRGGCFGPAQALAGKGTRRKFTESDRQIAHIISRVSQAFETERGGHAGLVTLYNAVADAARGQSTTHIHIPLSAGVTLQVRVTELLGCPT